MILSLQRERLRQTQFVRRGALISSFYSGVLLIAVGGAAFELWPPTLFRLVGVGYLLALTFAWAMCLFFFPHLEPRRFLASDTLLDTDGYATITTNAPDTEPGAAPLPEALSA